MLAYVQQHMERDTIAIVELRLHRNSASNPTSTSPDSGTVRDRLREQWASRLWMAEVANDRRTAFPLVQLGHHKSVRLRQQRADDEPVAHELDLNAPCRHAARERVRDIASPPPRPSRSASAHASAPTDAARRSTTAPAGSLNTTRPIRRDLGPRSRTDALGAPTARA